MITRDESAIVEKSCHRCESKDMKMFFFYFHLLPLTIVAFPFCLQVAALRLRYTNVMAANELAL
jgi:hypothetical protein